MKRWRIGLLLIVVLLAPSCGAGGSVGGGHDHAHMDSAPAQEPEFGEQVSVSEADRTVQVKALDTLRFDPATIEVDTGEVIKFEITNAGHLDHEFVLGYEDYHQSDAARMNAGHNHSTGVFVAPGETAETVWRFDKAGKVVFACHVDDHYAAGMEGSLIVEAP